MVLEWTWSTLELGPGAAQRCLCMAGLPSQGDLLIWPDCAQEQIPKGSVTDGTPCSLRHSLQCWRTSQFGNVWLNDDEVPKSLRGFWWFQSDFDSFLEMDSLSFKEPLCHQRPQPSPWSAQFLAALVGNFSGTDNGNRSEVGWASLWPVKLIWVQQALCPQDSYISYKSRLMMLN